MKPIRVVTNKNGSQTVYVPAELTDLFQLIIEAGDTDVFESQTYDYEDVPTPLFEWEHR